MKSHDRPPCPRSAGARNLQLRSCARPDRTRSTAVPCIAGYPDPPGPTERVVDNEHWNPPVSATAKRRVTLVVVSYNSSDDLPGLLSTLPAASGSGVETQVVVADNASADGSPELVQELSPTATLIRMPQNLGYAAGINAAVNAAGPSDAILALNADTRLTPSCVDRLLDGLEQVGVGITVPRLVDAKGELQHSLRREPRVLATLFEAAVGGNRAGWFIRFGEVIREPAAYERPTQADWATGAAMMISRRCWDATGPWDESFFLFAEEAEYALRSRDAGFRLALVPDAEAVHLGGPSSDDPRLWSMIIVNRLRLFRRRNGRLRSVAYWASLVLNEAIRAAMGRKVHQAGLSALLFRSRRPVEVRHQPERD